MSIQRELTTARIFALRLGLKKTANQVPIIAYSPWHLVEFSVRQIDSTAPWPPHRCALFPGRE